MHRGSKVLIIVEVTLYELHKDPLFLYYLLRISCHLGLKSSRIEREDAKTEPKGVTVVK